MMQPEFFQPSWPYTTMDFSIDEVRLCSLDSLGLYSDIGSFEFCSSLASREGSSVSSPNQYSSSVYSDDSYRYPPFGKDLVLESLLNLEESTVSGLCEWMECKSELPSLEDSEDGLTSSLVLMETPSPQLSLILPEEDTELDNQLSVSHLLKAYGEAIENRVIELAEAILARLEEKACLVGKTVQRLAYYLIRSLDQCGGYLRHESITNYREAFLAFYQIFPYGKFAHFSANSMIMNSLPKNAEIIHIVDFDVGEGVQWAPLIESLGRRHHKGALKLTSIKWEEEDCDSHPSLGRFEEIKGRLLECAYYFNVKLEVEEMKIEGLVSELNKVKKKKDGGNDWLAFNCMVNLPHMGRVRSDRHIVNFLKLAKDSVSGNTGIITFGDGNLKGRMDDYSGFGSFLDGQFGHFYALLESMDWYFPSEVLEVRVVIECLFVAPYLSSLACLQKWEERSGWGGKDILGIGLEGWKVSEDSVAEAKELVREGESRYWVTSDDENDNLMVLGYIGTPLVQVSCWR